MSNEPKVLETIRNKLQELYGPRDKRVVVLGSFDTWPCMDFVCRRLAEMGYTAFTSLFTYKLYKLPDGSLRIDRAPNNLPHDMGISLVGFLRLILAETDKAIVLYSVCGAHYIETEWLSQGLWDVLGIALVRDIGKDTDCLKIIPQLECSVCTGEPPIWDCLPKACSCPFEKQEISKDVIERFLLSRQRMRLVAIQNLDAIKNLLAVWLSGNVNKQIPP